MSAFLIAAAAAPGRAHVRPAAPGGGDVGEVPPEDSRSSSSRDDDDPGRQRLAVDMLQHVVVSRVARTVRNSGSVTCSSQLSLSAVARR
ncbi:hypothetical protein [Streptomyces sp. NP160]|uniref:hypothetical protein n=1 Tax=Streptomyces sp. NP160 TaxID=2586637 RepID=UPI0015D57566|nr:hypothetical protein [Streptomyces sp. NP160]